MVKRSLVLLAAFGAVAAFGCRGAEGGSTAAPLASGQVSVTALAANGAYLYWTMASGSVRRVAIDGGKIETLADGLHEPDLLAVDDTDVYVYALDGEILRIPKTGGAPTRLADGQNHVVGIQLDDVFVVWATQDGQIRRAPKNGGSAGLLASAPNGLTAIGQQSGEIFWTAGGGDKGVLDAVSSSGGPTTVTTLVQGLGAPRQLAVAPKAAFFVATNQDNVDPTTGAIKTTNSISGAALDGSNVQAISSDAGNVAALVGDDATVFIAVGSNMTSLAFSALPATGGEPVSFANGPVGTPSLALDETSIYWASSGDGNIFTLPKAETSTTTPE